MPPSVKQSKRKPPIRRALDDLTNAYSNVNHGRNLLLSFDTKKQQRKEHQLACLTEVCAHLDHFDTGIHDNEITDHEVDHVLVFVLDSIIKDGNDVSMELVTDQREDEIRMLCSALEMLYRASAEAVYSSYKGVGKSMLPHLLILLKHFRPQSMTCGNGSNSESSCNTNASSLTSSLNGCLPFSQAISMSNSCMNSTASITIPPSAFAVLKTADIITFNIYKILLYFSRVAYVRKEIFGEVQDLLASLVCGLNEEVQSTPLALQPSEQYCSVANKLAREMRSIQLRSLANLSHEKGNKVLMMNFPTLISALIKSITRSEKEKEYVGILLMNLSVERVNQISMVSDYEGDIINALVKLTQANSSETVDYASMAIENLAYSKKNRIPLITQEGGIILDALLDLVQNRPDLHNRLESVRRRATGALMNLACPETAQIMGSHPKLLFVLSMIASSDAPGEVASRSSSALLKISSEITVSMPEFAVLLSALVNASASPNIDIITVIIRQKAKNNENREFVATYPGVVQCLCDIGSRHDTSSRAKENIAKALMHLTNTDKNKYTMTAPNVLDALISLSSNCNYEITQPAVTAVARLASEQKNRKAMALHKGLITALAKAVEIETESRRNRSSVVAMAKPALITLLVAL